MIISAWFAVKFHEIVSNLFARFFCKAFNTQKYYRGLFYRFLIKKQPLIFLRFKTSPALNLNKNFFFDDI